MELKLLPNTAILPFAILLIVPYGIETQFRVIKYVTYNFF